MKKIPNTDSITCPLPIDMGGVARINQSSYADLGEWHYRSFVDYLAKNYKKYPSRYDQRMHNIFNTKRYLIENDEKIQRYYKDRMKGTPFIRVVSYILQYQPGGFLMPHQDPKGRITTVTLLEDDDLVGGESLVYKDIHVPKSLSEKKTYSDVDFANESESNEWTIYKNACPVFIPPRKHETYAIGEQRSHSVTRIEKGTRTVLIEWWYYTEDVKGDSYE